MRVEWKLYEEGSLVAQGNVIPQQLNQPMEFALLDVLRNPYAGNRVSVTFPTCTVDLVPVVNWGAFLRIGPDNVKNRMGDEASPAGVGRKRELRYTLVAQTVAATQVLNPSSGLPEPGVPIVDPTPATVEFSIYVREMLDKVREEQPVRIYERGQQNQ